MTAARNSIDVTKSNDYPGWRAVDQVRRVASASEGTATGPGAARCGCLPLPRIEHPRAMVRLGRVSNVGRHSPEAELWSQHAAPRDTRAEPRSRRASSAR